MVSLQARQDSNPLEIDDSADDESPLSSVNEDLLDSDLSEFSQTTPRKPQKASTQTNSILPKSSRPEPATDDEPLSSSDEEPDLPDDDDDGITPRKKRQAGPTLEEKLARKNNEEKEFKSPSSSRKRTMKDMLGSDDTREDMFDFIRPSQQSFKSKRQSYSKFRKTPSSSMAGPSSSAARPKSASGPAAKKSESPKKEEEEESKEEIKFIFPPELPDPASASSFSVPTSSARDRGIPDTDDEDDDSVLSSPKSYPSPNDIMNDADEDEEEAPREYLCPMCNEPVDPGLLIKFEAQPRQRFRDQQAFCNSHKKSSIEDQWVAKGYPTIDWENFDERIQAHFNDLEKLLAPGSSSYYRNVLISTLKSGKAKNFALTLAGDSLETISCGYYGTRGSGIMLDAITARFSRKLTRLAKEDKIITQAGPVGYSQSVLVPELAVRLIKEDMKVDEETARQIMRESIDLGEKVNFAPNDTVHVSEEEMGTADGEGEQ
ncbi:RTC4-like domain-containing protein [Aspergillus pseudodeflectus]|uniref:Restriction of telomere capping protein 4 n=1 Tax=Aspergillus pseudodeflectus TaxID=176178 RepID=A0ABR4K8R6_9EURO